MLLAQGQLATEVFFPPWYFWLFVLGTVIVLFVAITTMVYLSLSAETQRRIHERETAARLIEVMLVQRKMSAREIEQVLNSYWRLGTFWSRVCRWFAGPADLPVAGMLRKTPNSPEAEHF